MRLPTIRNILKLLLRFICMERMVFAPSFFLLLIVLYGLTSAIPLATIKITSEPSDAVVVLDDVPRGVTPLEVYVLTGADHSLSISKNGYATYITTVSVKSGEIKEINAKLKPNPQ